ncbi:site-2 protease family protein [Paenibacillus senegalensis]|uniref:site-2 protease family protein n=1 Tax=Paenibacillus senegalensis TaxID=1465766 RepID=UPI000288B768|nr:site-2 protease family protein [Paenibacillus senegalensis]
MEGKQKESSDLLQWIGRTRTAVLERVKALLPFVKMGSVGGAILTMLVSVGAYALIAPLQIAVGLVIMVLIHELGHVLAAKQKGLPMSAPVFIPFLGALVNMRRQPRDAATEAYIAMGGPLLGTIGAAISFWLGYTLELSLFKALAYIGFILNLINLLPIHPLDGGRIAVAVSRWLWLVGLTVGLLVIIYFKLFVLFIFWLLFALDLLRKVVLNRWISPVKSLTASYQLPVSWVQERGDQLPEKGTRKELAYATHSELDGKQLLFFLWPEIGLRGMLVMPAQAIIVGAQVTDLEYRQKKEETYLLVHCRVEFTHYENDQYFQVPVRYRWGLGTVYAVLFAYLVTMLYLLSRNGLPIEAFSRG